MVEELGFVLVLFFFCLSLQLRVVFFWISS